MKQIPILYSGEMVKAYFAGLKTQTRRTRGLEEINKEPDKWRYKGQGYKNARDKCYIFGRTDSLTTVRVKCPFGQAGDMLVGKETWQVNDWNYPQNPESVLKENIEYRADALTEEEYYHPEGWKPSIFMPLEFSRIHQPLLCDPVPQRVWDMTEAEAIAEGMETLKKLFYESTGTLPTSAVQIFAWYWDLLNAKRGYPWSGNPWAWKLVFPRHEG